MPVSLADIRKHVESVRAIAAYRAGTGHFDKEVADRLIAFEKTCVVGEMRALSPQIIEDLKYCIQFAELKPSFSDSPGLKNESNALIKAIQEYGQQIAPTQNTSSTSALPTFAERHSPTETDMPASTIGSRARLLASMIKEKGAYSSDGPGLFALVTALKEAGIIPQTTVMQKLPDRGPENNGQAR